MTPGFVYNRTFRRFSARDARSSTVEVVELFSAGALTTFLALVVTLALGEGVPFLVSLESATTGSAGFQAHPWEWVASGALVMALSTVLSFGAGRLAGSRSSARIGQGMRDGLATARALTDRSPAGRLPFLSVELSDGRLLEGRLRYFSTEADPARRDLVLQRPLAWTGPGSVPRAESQAELIIVPGSIIRVIHISYPELQRRPPSP